MRKRYFAVSSLLVLLASSFAAGSQTVTGTNSYETRTYTVKKGDSLWGIASSQLKDPFQWPLVWKENGLIKNPDLIYPRQKINIPLAYARPQVLEPTEETAPKAQAPAQTPAQAPIANAAAAPAPIQKQYLFTSDDLLSCGFLTKTVLDVGKVDSAVNGRQVITEGDDIYLGLKSPAMPGDKFIIADVQKVEDPVTGDDAGYRVTQLGIAQVIRTQGLQARATVTKVYGVIYLGDTVLDYSEPAPVEAGPARTPDISGYVVTLRKTRPVGAEWDVAYLNKGRLDGFEPGDEVQTLFGPDPNAKLRIMVVTANTATAMIESSKKPVEPGDKFTGIK